MSGKQFHEGADTPPMEKTGEAHLEHHGRSGSDVALEHTPFSRMTPEERAAALKMAHDADPGPATFSMAYLRFFLTCVVVFVNSCDTGFDTTIMSSVNSMLQFQEFFGLTTSATGTSLVFGIFTVGGVTAFFANIILPDLIGRRYSMLYGNTLLIAGAVLSGTARSMPQLLAGRWLTGFGASTAALSAKTYMAEITSPFNRGRYMGVLNSFYYVGQILATGVAIPLGKIQSEYSWRVCLFLQCAPAIVNVLFVYFISESPRWLYARNRKDEAIAILARYHSATGDVNSPIIRIEIEEIEESISVDGADRRFWDFSKLFNSHSNRYRFGLCAMMSVWGQLSGNGMITYFLPTLLGQAGITNRDRQRELNLVNAVTSMIGALTGSAIVDHVGRRKLMLTGVGCASIGMLIVGCLLSPAGEQSKTRADAGVSFIFLFMVAFSFGFTPLQGLYPAEVLTFENRAKGLSLQAWVTSGVSTINTFGLPVALQKVGYIMYLIFFAWDIVGFAVIWLFAVETKQLSLEEMEEVFSAPKPKQRSFELARAARLRAKAAKEAQASNRV